MNALELRHRLNEWRVRARAAGIDVTKDIWKLRRENSIKIVKSNLLG